MSEESKSLNSTEETLIQLDNMSTDELLKYMLQFTKERCFAIKSFVNFVSTDTSMKDVFLEPTKADQTLVKASEILDLALNHINYLETAVERMELHIRDV